MNFMQALKPNKKGMRRAQHTFVNGKFHHIYSIQRNENGYRVYCTIINTWNDRIVREGGWNVSYLTDLFAFAKRGGFFEKINPNADDWVGTIDPEPILSPEEEAEEQRILRDAWEGAHPGEAPIPEYGEDFVTFFVSPDNGMVQY